MSTLVEVITKLGSSHCVGDMSFIEDLLPEGVKVYHQDSYNDNRGKRFQGIFYIELINATLVRDCAPLNILKECINYDVWANSNHIMWTIWFE